MKIEVNIEALKRLKETIASTEEQKRQELISYLDREIEREQRPRSVFRAFGHWSSTKTNRLEDQREIVKIEGTLSEFIALSNIFKDR